MAGNILNRVDLDDEGNVVAEQSFTENTGKLVIPNPNLWDTENPYLYDLKIEAGEDYYYDFAQGKFVKSDDVEGDATDSESLGQCANHEGDYIIIDGGKVVWSDSAHADKCK